MKYLRAFLLSLIQAIPFLGLLLLGWGIDDLQGFLSNFPRLGYLVIVPVFGFIDSLGVIGGSAGSPLNKGDEGKRVRRQRVLLFPVFLFQFVVLFFLSFADRRTIGVMVGQEIRWLGLVLCGLGFAMISWSRFTLGRMYTLDVTIQKSHQLITTGLYRYIRNPIYLGVIAHGLGLSFLFRSWIGLGAMIPIVVFFLFRIKDEEGALQKEFGSEWEAYCKQSWRLVPYLY
jgi:protein-S-isoprenylcysteine O-methyltransferase Ste14